MQKKDVSDLTASPSPSKPCIRDTPDRAPPPAKPAATCPRDPEPQTGIVATVPLTFTANQTKVDVELALSDHQIEKGLMYRAKMAESRGMLFRMRERREHTFWMKNTCIPLDMLFIDDDGTIVGIVENVPTLNEDERTVGCPSSWVLELNAGFSRAHGIVAGQKVTIPDAARR